MPFLTYLNRLRYLIVRFMQRFRHRHLRKREFEHFLRYVCGFSREKAVRWAKYIK